MKRFTLVFLLLIACSPRGAITLAPEAAAVGEVHQIYVGTSRAIDPETGRFGGERSEAISFARYDISVPPERVPGNIRFPPRGAKPNPARDFLTTAEVIEPNARTFRTHLASAFRAEPRGRRDAVIFVHGFNNTFSKGVYRIAQLSADLDLPGVMMHYSWPSAGSPLGYAYDRDSAIFARNGLEQLMIEAAAAGAERIVLVAHSMGSALTMEVLRQIAIRGNKSLQAKVSGVVLISPDLDVDVFRSQAQTIGKLPQPFVIVGSDRDRLLDISAKISGQPARLGNIKDISPLADLQVTFLDVAAYTDGVGHFPLGDNPALLGLMGRVVDLNAAFGADERARVGLLPGVVLTVQSATEIILAPVGAIAEGIEG